MGCNTTGEIQKGSERELYKYVNHQTGTTKASTRINNISRDDDDDVQYSESCREVHKLIGFVVIIVRWEVVTFLRGLLVPSIIIAKCALLVNS